MIQSLRIKLIALSMAALLLVLLIIMGSINVLNYRNIVREADQTLAILADNNGVFPRELPKEGGKPPFFSPELPFESRFFSVQMSEDGAVTSVDTGRIAAVDTASAISYAQSVWSGNANAGFAGNYRFIRQTAEDGAMKIIFLDCGRSLSTFRTFLTTSCGISLAGLLAVFLLITLFSGRIIKPVAQSYEKQKQFITNAGHELKTPLTIIDADAELLAMDLGENEWLQDIQLQSKRLAGLTNDLIYLSRMEEDQNQFQMIEFPFSDLVEEVTQSFGGLARKRERVLASRIQPMLTVRGDEKALRQLVSVLLDNALKHAAGEGEISLVLERQGRYLSLSVQNPAQLSRGDLPHLFDRFYRSNASRGMAPGGFGIGLSVAKAVVAAHKGKVTATMPDDTSLQITVLLPAV